MSKIPDGFAGRALSTQGNGYLKNLMPVLGRLDRKRHLIRNLQPVAFQRHHFARVVRKHSNPPQPQIDQNLRANTAFMLHEPLPPQILFRALTRMVTNRRKRCIFRRTRINSKSAPSVMQVHKHAAIGRSNRRQRPLDNLVAIARR